MDKKFIKKAFIFGLGVLMLYGISRCWTAPERTYNYYSQTDAIISHTG